jgi:Uncharacterized protein conserved in bacteria (DUF2252)
MAASIVVAGRFLGVDGSSCADAALAGVRSYRKHMREYACMSHLDVWYSRIGPDYRKLCGWALALAHAKSGDAAMIAGYLGGSDGMDDAVARFALAYSTQTERDYDALVKAARTGRIKVAKGT